MCHFGSLSENERCRQANVPARSDFLSGPTGLRFLRLQKETLSAILRQNQQVSYLWYVLNWSYVTERLFLPYICLVPFKCQGMAGLPSDTVSYVPRILSFATNFRRPIHWLGLSLDSETFMQAPLPRDKI